MRMERLKVGASLLCAGLALGATYALGWAAPATSPQARVDAAYAAMGGDKIAAIKTLSLKAHLGQWDPGESYSVHDQDKPGVNSSELEQMWDFSRGLVRNYWWDRPNN